MARRMTVEEESILDRFFDGENWITASDKEGELPSSCYMHDSWRDNPEFTALCERVKLPEGDPQKVYVCTLSEEEGIGTISSGWHYVNRMGYFFSTTPLDIPEEGIRYW
jgi:hypothetical protein